ncbi:MAG TPA: LysR family transcriptional regulator [Reyranella sp.]|jgi:DNA-binding transcriptional LysR family regulator|nr:LysR family transcriptional regulator [Reyranella sp.]
MIDISSPAYPEPKLGELRVLATLLQEPSITRTAQILGTTQPAVSKVIGRLRRQFGDPLFVRNGRAMQPTARALELAGRLRTLLAAVDDLRSHARTFDPTCSTRQFSLLLTDVGMIHFLPPLVARIAALAPGVRLRAVPLQAHQIEARLEAGDADLALGAFPRAARHLRRQRLYADGYLGAARKNHPRLGRLRSRSGFLAEQHILVAGSETGHAAHEAAQTALAGALAPANVLLQVPSFVAGAIVAAETDGIVTLPANVARRLAGPLGLGVFDCPLALPRIEIAQYWHERYHRDDGHRWMRQLTFALFGRRR